MFKVDYFPEFRGSLFIEEEAMSRALILADLEISRQRSQLLAAMIPRQSQKFGCRPTNVRWSVTLGDLLFWNGFQAGQQQRTL